MLCINVECKNTLHYLFKESTKENVPDHRDPLKIIAFTMAVITEVIYML